MGAAAVGRRSPFALSLHATRAVSRHADCRHAGHGAAPDQARGFGILARMDLTPTSGSLLPRSPVTPHRLIDHYTVSDACVRQRGRGRRAGTQRRESVGGSGPLGWQQEVPVAAGQAALLAACAHGHTLPSSRSICGASSGDTCGA